MSDQLILEEFAQGTNAAAEIARTALTLWESRELGAIDDLELFAQCVELVDSCEELVPDLETKHSLIIAVMGIAGIV